MRMRSAFFYAQVWKSGTLLAILLAISVKVVGQPTLRANSGINPSDTYVTMDITVLSQNTTTFDQPVYDPSTGTSTTTMQLNNAGNHYHVEVGYNTNDEQVINLYSQDPAADPTSALVDDISRIQVINDKIVIYDLAGNPLPIVVPMNMPLPRPLSFLSGQTGQSLLKGLVISSPSQTASATGGTVQMTTTSALYNGAGTTSVAQITYSNTSVPGSSVWSYQSTGSSWLLAQVGVYPDSSTSQITQLANIGWNFNSTGDARRASESVAGSAVPAPSTLNFVQPAASNPFACSSITEGQPAPFAQNFAFQHGIKSGPDAFQIRMDAWLSGDFQFGEKFLTCTSSFDRLLNQASASAAEIAGTGQTNFIILGHSQGGLIARDVAQHHPELIKGVITLDTPNTGAILALTGKAALILAMDRLVNRLLNDAGCSSPFDNPGCAVGELVRIGIDVESTFTFDAAVPATVDLQPGSPYLNGLNSASETFPRVSIEGHSSRRWIEVRLLGDEFFNPEDLGGGRSLVFFTQLAYIAFRVCAVVALAFGDFDAFSFCTRVANDMDRIDIFYNVITALPFDGSDGIVQGSSQAYPGGGTARYVINRSDSHTGVIKSDKDRVALDTTLNREFLVPKPGCTYTISPTSLSFGFAGGDGSITVSTQTGCIWSAVASDPWIAVLTRVGTGPATVPFQVNLNLSPAARSGNITITVAATPLTTTINQDSAPPDGVATQDLTVSGYEQTYDYTPPCESDMTVCPPDTIYYDFGNMNVSVNGHAESVQYGNDDTVSLASAVAAAFHNDSGSPVDSTSFGSTVHLIARLAGTAPVLWPISCSSSTGFTTYFSDPSFTFSVCPPVLNNVAGARTLAMGPSSSCESWGSNRIDCFARGTDDSLAYTAWNGSSWQPFVSLGSVLASKPSCVSWAANRIDCFVVGSDQALWHQAWNGTQWQGWDSRGGSFTSNPSCTAWGPNRLDCLVRGTDQALWHIAWNGTAWTNWESLGGILTTEPNCVSWGAGRIDCLVLGTDFAVYHQAFNGTTWSGWEGLGGIGTSTPNCTSWGSGRLDCFVRGTDGAMHHRWYNGTQWGPWESLGGFITSAPSCVSWGFNRIDCFVRGGDNGMWHMAWSGTQWVGWDSQGGITMTSGPNCESWGFNRLDCFARSTDNALWHKAWDGSQWSAWDSRGGSIQ